MIGGSRGDVRLPRVCRSAYKRARFGPSKRGQMPTSPRKRRIIGETGMITGESIKGTSMSPERMRFRWVLPTFVVVLAAGGAGYAWFHHPVDAAGSGQTSGDSAEGVEPPAGLTVSVVHPR